ncbi:MAG TPA: ATP-dependent helicase, partial [Candidatus Paceibacterota bacterium]|nr:ATP-dependent helicase [Candidatus Paceibacterota bacterium]
LPMGEGLEAFMESAALASDQDELKETTDAVRLMTVHAAKGLEFLHVFIVGLEDGLFPYEREDDTENSKEEERRLMYVALTRAQKKVFLSYASYRTIFGSKNATLPSQFLSDIPQELLEWEAPERRGRTIYLD